MLRDRLHAGGTLSRAWLVLAWLAAACASAPPVPPQKPRPAIEAGTVFVGATVFDGERFRAGAVHVVGGTIAGFVDAPPPGARVVDARGRTLLPGLIDGHTHAGEDVHHLERMVEFGVTTAIDLFGPPEFLARMRASDAAPGAERRAALFGAGTLATPPNGHGTEYGVPIPTIARPEDAPAFVAARRAEGSDFLKLVIDNATLDVSGKPLPPMPTLAPETVVALVRAGHAAGLVVSAHIGTCADLGVALDAGVDVVAHGCPVGPNEDLVTPLVAKKAFLTPTLAVQLRPCGMEYWIPMVQDAELAARLTEEERKRLGADRKTHDPACSGPRLRLAGDAARAGVRLVAGPDAPNRRLPFGASLLAEVELLRQAGATTEQALAAATSNAADAYRVRDRGRIAPGQRADLLLVDGDVRADPRALWHTREVWRGGKVAWAAPARAP